jgi:hypothetical protein
VLSFCSRYIVWLTKSLERPLNPQNQALHYSGLVLKVEGFDPQSHLIETTDEFWWRRVDSNHGPTDYETVALAT